VSPLTDDVETIRDGKKIPEEIFLSSESFRSGQTSRRDRGRKWRGTGATTRSSQSCCADDRNSQRSKPMKRTVVRYKTKPESGQENERLIQNVFEELRAKSPDGVRYLEAFKSFQSGIKERCIEPPQSSDVTIVGNYRMLDE
jgi:hypothetical protein